MKPTSVISIREGQVRGAKGWSKGPVGSDRPRTSPILTSKSVYILKFSDSIRIRVGVRRSE